MKPVLCEQTWRWYGPNDPITLADIKQTGVTAVSYTHLDVYKRQMCVLGTTKSTKSTKEDGNTCC